VREQRAPFRWVCEECITLLRIRLDPGMDRFVVFIRNGQRKVKHTHTYIRARNGLRTYDSIVKVPTVMYIKTSNECKRYHLQLVLILAHRTQ